MDARSALLWWGGLGVGWLHSDAADKQHELLEEHDVRGNWLREKWTNGAFVGLASRHSEIHTRLSSLLSCFEEGFPSHMLGRGSTDVAIQKPAVGK